MEARVPLSRVLRPALVVLALAASLAGTEAAAQEPSKQECVEANESAQDLQRAEKLVEARAQLETCAARACPHAVRQDCSDRLRAVETALPTVAFAVKDAARGDTTLATCTIDGAPVTPTPAGSPVPIDPGPHTIVFSLEGRTPVSLRITLREGDHVQRDVVFKAPKAGQPVAADASVEAPAADGAPAPPPEPVRAAGPTPVARRVGWAALGAGAAGVVLGSVFGFVGMAKRSALHSACAPDGSCTQASQPDIDSLHFNAVAADIAYGVGILGLGAGTVLLIAFPEAPKPEVVASVRVRPWVGVGDVGLAGSFP
jgi:hypothetical protein